MLLGLFIRNLNSIWKSISEDLKTKNCHESMS